MKNASRVFIWIGLISGAWLILPLIIGIFSLRAINNATCKKDLTGWAIASLICCSMLGGIFMLNIKEEDLNGGEKIQKQIIAQRESPVNEDCVSQLKGLKKLLDEEIITED